MTNDARASRLTTGLVFALLAALFFGMSGSLGRGLMDAGWTAGAATLARVSIGAAVLLVPGIVALRGDWTALRKAWATVLAYGLLAVAGAQLFYFLAVQTLNVGVALLIEYMAPIAIVFYLWITKGAKPGVLTLAGAGVALAGLVLLLDIVGGGQISLTGIGWALLAMVGAAVYFLISGSTSTGLPPLTLAAAGLVVATLALGAAAVAGLLPVTFASADVALAGGSLPAWMAVGALGVICAAFAYVTGIAATRRLGARLGSFVSLTEVIAAATFAWLLLGQTPVPVQIAGAVLVLGGVVLVKLGEPKEAELAVEPLPSMDAVTSAAPVVAHFERVLVADAGDAVAPTLIAHPLQDFQGSMSGLGAWRGF